MVAKGDTDRGGVDEGDEASFHSEPEPEPEKKLLVGAHAWLSTSGGELLEGGVFASGLGEGEGALAMTASGGRMVNIWSSACGGPYESNGSGTDWSMGSKIGSEAFAVNLSNMSIVERTATQTFACTTFQTSSSCSIISR